MRNMTIRALILATLMLVPAIAHAWDLELAGSIGKYPVVVQLNTNPLTGVVEGRYAYISTLQKNGIERRNSWLYIISNDSRLNSFSVYNCDNQLVETWHNVNFSNYRHALSINGIVRTIKGKQYRLNADCNGYGVPDWVLETIGVL